MRCKSQLGAKFPTFCAQKDAAHKTNGINKGFAKQILGWRVTTVQKYILGANFIQASFLKVGRLSGDIQN